MSDKPRPAELVVRVVRIEADEDGYVIELKVDRSDAATGRHPQTQRAYRIEARRRDVQRTRIKERKVLDGKDKESG